MHCLFRCFVSAYLDSSVFICKFYLVVGKLVDFFGALLQEKLLMELKNADNDILENQNDTDGFKDSEAFKKHYATVLVQLKEASEQACGFHGLLSVTATFSLDIEATFD